MMADYVVTYDVSTQTPAGRRRLRHVARACCDFGQRVQLSVFECSVSDMQLEALITRIDKIIDPESDSLRVYRLMGGREAAVTVVGRDNYTDYSDPLVV